MGIRHVYSNQKPDGTDAGVVRPSDWNSEHAYTLQDGVSLAGTNTAGVLAAISSGTLHLAGGSNITLSQDGNTVSFVGAGGGLTNVKLSAGALSALRSDVTFSNANGISFGLETNGAITATYTVPSVPAQTAQTLGLYGSSNTQLTSSGTVDARSFTVRAMGSLTVAVSASEIVLSAPNAITTAMLSNAATLSNVRISASGGSALGSDFTFANSNGFTFGIDTAARQVTASYTVPSVPAQTNQTVGLYASSNTYLTSSGTVDARSLSFRGDKSITIGVSAGEVLFSVGAYLTTAMASNRGSDFVAATAAFAGTNASGTINSTGISVSVAAPGGGNALTVQDSATTLAVTKLVFSNANNVSFGLSTAASLATVTATITVPAQTNQSVGLYASSNTMLTSSGTADARSLSFRGMGNVSIAVSASEVVISVPAGGGGITNVNLSAGTTSQNLSAFVFSDSNRLSFGLDGSTVTAKHALNFSAGTTSNNISDQVVFSNANGLSFGLADSTVTASGPFATLVQFEPFPLANPLTTTWVPAVGSWYVQPFVLPQHLAPGRINYLVANSNTSQGVCRLSSGNLFASNTTGTMSAAYRLADTWALYTRGTGANDSILSTIWSNTRQISLTASVSVILTNASQVRLSASLTISYIGSIGTDGSYTLTSYGTSTSTSTAGSSASTTIASAAFSSIYNRLTGSILQNVGLTKSLTPGNYWLAGAYSTSITTGGTSLQDMVPFVHEVGLYGASSEVYRGWPNTVSVTSSQYAPGAGVWSAQSNAAPNTIAFNAIRSFASHVTQYFNVLQSSL